MAIVIEEKQIVNLKKVTEKVFKLLFYRGGEKSVRDVHKQRILCILFTKCYEFP